MTVRYKLSPELGDGQHMTIVDTKDEVVSAVRDWCGFYADFPGEQCTVETVEMSDEEVEKLGDV